MRRKWVNDGAIMWSKTSEQPDICHLHEKLRRWEGACFCLWSHMTKWKGKLVWFHLITFECLWRARHWLWWVSRAWEGKIQVLSLRRFAWTTCDGAEVMLWVIKVRTWGWTLVRALSREMTCSFGVHPGVQRVAPSVSGMYLRIGILESVASSPVLI